MSRNARSVEPLKITSAKIDIAGLQQTLFVGVPARAPQVSASVSSKDLHDPQDAHLVRRARQIRPRKWPLTVPQRDERRASTQHAEKSNHFNPCL